MTSNQKVFSVSGIAYRGTGGRQQEEYEVSAFTSTYIVNASRVTPPYPPLSVCRSMFCRRVASALLALPHTGATVIYSKAVLAAIETVGFELHAVITGEY